MSGSNSLLNLFRKKPKNNPDDPVPPYTPPYDPTTEPFIQGISSASEETRADIQRRIMDHRVAGGTGGIVGVAAYQGMVPIIPAANPETARANNSLAEMAQNFSSVEEYEAAVLALVLQRSAQEAEEEANEKALREAQEYEATLRAAMIQSAAVNRDSSPSFRAIDAPTTSAEATSKLRRSSSSSELDASRQRGLAGRDHATASAIQSQHAAEANPWSFPAELEHRANPSSPDDQLVRVPVQKQRRALDIDQIMVAVHAGLLLTEEEAQMLREHIAEQNLIKQQQALQMQGTENHATHMATSLPSDSSSNPNLNASDQAFPSAGILPLGGFLNPSEYKLIATAPLPNGLSITDSTTFTFSSLRARPESFSLISNHPLTSCTINTFFCAYFEVTISPLSQPGPPPISVAQHRRPPVVSIGMATTGYPSTSAPGCFPISVAFLSTGQRAHCTTPLSPGSSLPETTTVLRSAFGLPFSAPRTIGCGYIPAIGGVFFTMDGEFLGEAFSLLSQPATGEPDEAVTAPEFPFHACIGCVFDEADGPVSGVGYSFSVNFGASRGGFVYGPARGGVDDGASVIDSSDWDNDDMAAALAASLEESIAAEEEAPELEVAGAGGISRRAHTTTTTRSWDTNQRGSSVFVAHPASIIGSTASGNESKESSGGPSAVLASPQISQALNDTMLRSDVSVTAPVSTLSQLELVQKQPSASAPFESSPTVSTFSASIGEKPLPQPSTSSVPRSAMSDPMPAISNHGVPSTIQTIVQQPQRQGLFGGVAVGGSKGWLRKRSNMQKELMVMAGAGGLRPPMGRPRSNTSNSNSSAGTPSMMDALLTGGVGGSGSGSFSIINSHPTAPKVSPSAAALIASASGPPARLTPIPAPAPPVETFALSYEPRLPPQPPVQPLAAPKLLYEPLFPVVPSMTSSVVPPQKPSLVLGPRIGSALAQPPRGLSAGTPSPSASSAMPVRSFIPKDDPVGEVGTAERTAGDEGTGQPARHAIPSWLMNLPPVEADKD